METQPTQRPIPGKPTLLSLAAFVLAAGLAAGAAMVLATAVERYNANRLGSELFDSGLQWVAFDVDGLRVHLSGTAPSESARIRALQVAGGLVNAARVSESFEVASRSVVVAPVFRIEMMRNLDEISIIGLVPAAEGDAPIIERLTAIASEMTVADMVQTAEHAVPAGWNAAVDFAVQALALVPVAQISVTAGRIEVHALVQSAEARQRLEARLREIAPRGQVLILDLVAPRPVIAPFTLRFEIDAEGARFDACAADTEAARDVILRAARAAGANGRLSCVIGLGAPTPRWGRAVEQAIVTLSGLGGGTVTFSDNDVSLVVPGSVGQGAFDRAVGRLETQLPDAFNLTAVRLEPEGEGGEGAAAGPEVLATLSPEGELLIEGRLPDARIRDSVSAFARARFGSAAVAVEARLDDTLPSGWSVRVLTALEALAELHYGNARIRSERVELAGVSGNPEASALVSRILSEGLGQGADFSVRVRYDAALDPVEQEPTPERCEERIQTILVTNKITFAPGSAALDDESREALDLIAEVLRDCGEMEMEIAGHTDSQGRAETNLALSQARAEAVINALLARRVLVSGMQARGYGAEQPIADNATAEGREINRRIEFSLIRPEPEPEPIDPALEELLEFEIRSPDADTTRPQPRPATVETPSQGASDDPAEEGPEDTAPAESD
ncbi:MAG: OmpA family protein [Pararhodobacter sp.]